MIALAELLSLVSEHWPNRWERGRLLHVHRNAVKLSDGTYVHLRVMVQEVSPPADNTTDDMIGTDGENL